MRRGRTPTNSPPSWSVFAARVRVRVRAGVRVRVNPNPDPNANPNPNQVGLRGKEAKLLAMTPLMPGWEEVDGGAEHGVYYYNRLGLG